MKFTKKEKEFFLKTMIADVSKLQPLLLSLGFAALLCSLGSFATGFWVISSLDGFMGVFLGTVFIVLATFAARVAFGPLAQWHQNRWFIKNVRKAKSRIKESFMDHLDHCDGAEDILKIMKNRD